MSLVSMRDNSEFGEYERQLRSRSMRDNYEVRDYERQL